MLRNELKSKGGERMNSKQKMQLILVDDLLDKMVRLANRTNRVDYVPSYEEIQKIQIIKRYLDTILKNIS